MLDSSGIWPFPGGPPGEVGHGWQQYPHRFQPEIIFAAELSIEVPPIAQGEPADGPAGAPDDPEH